MPVYFSPKETSDPSVASASVDWIPFISPSLLHHLLLPAYSLHWLAPKWSGIGNNMKSASWTTSDYPEIGHTPFPARQLAGRGRRPFSRLGLLSCLIALQEASPSSKGSRIFPRKDLQVGRFTCVQGLSSIWKFSLQPPASSRAAFQPDHFFGFDSKTTLKIHCTLEIL